MSPCKARRPRPSRDRAAGSPCCPRPELSAQMLLDELPPRGGTFGCAIHLGAAIPQRETEEPLRWWAVWTCHGAQRGRGTLGLGDHSRGCPCFTHPRISSHGLSPVLERGSRGTARRKGERMDLTNTFVKEETARRLGSGFPLRFPNRFSFLTASAPAARFPPATRGSDVCTHVFMAEAHTLGFWKARKAIV